VERPGRAPYRVGVKRTSLVILTRNRAAALLGAVEAALALPERPPVVVVDNASTDETPRLLKERYPQVKLVRLPFDFGLAARNLGLQCVETAFAAFGTEDSRWDAGALDVAAGLLEFYPRVGALAARLLLEPDGREDPDSARLGASPLSSRGLPGPALLDFIDEAVVFRRKAFLEVAYEPRLVRGGEETLLAYDLAAAGWSIAYCDKLTVRRNPALAEDGAGRRTLLRNALWVAWLRRPLASALSLTLEYLREGDAKAALVDALGGIGWVLRERSVLPPAVEAMCRMLDAQPIRQRRFGGLPRVA
jgi:GT2 family glycosyltransferase